MLWLTVLKEEDGQDFVEYSLMLAFIVIMSTALMQSKISITDLMSGILGKTQHFLALGGQQ